MRVTYVNLLNLRAITHSFDSMNHIRRIKTIYDCLEREVGGWGRAPFSKNLMSPTPRRKWYLTTGRRAH